MSIVKLLILASASLVVIISAQPIGSRVFSRISHLEHRINYGDPLETVTQKVHEASDQGAKLSVSDNEHGYIPGINTKWITVEQSFLGQNIALLIVFDAQEHVERKILKLDGGTW